MAKTPALLTSPKIKKLAAKAVSAPSRLTSEETRDLGASVMAHLAPPQAAPAAAAKKGATVKTTKKTAVKTPAPKAVPAKKVAVKAGPARKTAVKKAPAPPATEPLAEQA